MTRISSPLRRSMLVTLILISATALVWGCGDQTGSAPTSSPAVLDSRPDAPGDRAPQAPPFAIIDFRALPKASALRDVRLDNIDEIRDIIEATYTTGEWDQMEAALLAVRADATVHVNTMGTMPPSLSSEYLVLESIVNSRAANVASQIMALLNSPGISRTTLSDGLAVAAADSTGGGPDEDAIDSWTLVHFISGCVLGEMGLDFKTTLTLLILWEVVEPHIWPGWHESPRNQVTDVVVGMIGWWLCTNDDDEQH